MMYQDILTNPDLTFDIFGSNTPIVIANVINKDRWSLVAVGYEQDIPVTYLAAIITGRSAELYYFSDAQFVEVNTVETADRHAHISRLSQNAAAYAGALDVDEFFVSANKNYALMKARLTRWTVVREDEHMLRMALRV